MPPVPARDAATIMLVRDASDGLEVCMLRRHLNSDFVGGAYVFPGGKVDEDDRSELAQTVCAGRTDAQASEILDVGSGGLAFFVAALRECFEEAGILLAYPAGATGGALYRPQDEAAESRLARFRVEVNAKRVGFLEACERRKGPSRGGQGSLLLALDHPRTGAEEVRHALLRSVRPSRSDRDPRRLRDRRDGMDPSARGLGPKRRRGVRPHLPDCEEPPGDLSVLHRRRADRGRRSGGAGTRRASAGHLGRERGEDRSSGRPGLRAGCRDLGPDTGVRPHARAGAGGGQERRERRACEAGRQGEVGGRARPDL